MFSLVLSYLAIVALSLSLSKEQGHIEYRGAVLSHVHESGAGYGSGHYKTTYPHLKKIGYDTVQLNTFAFVNHRKYTKIFSEGDPTMSQKSIESEILNLKKSGFKVMLKPHVWIAWWNFDEESWKKLKYHQDPRNQIDFKDPSLRAEWFSNYTDFIISQAELAERTGVDILVVGTELRNMSRYTSYWEEIISKVRDVYSGKITYSAENNNAFNIEFWDKLDYIGMDAYFDICKGETTIINILKSWWEIEPRIKKLSRKYGKKVIFTEVGYKSLKGSAERPWKWEKEGEASQRDQALAFEALTIAFNKKPYLAGVFIWKYYADLGAYNEDYIARDFTPYHKEAETIISGWFGSQ